MALIFRLIICCPDHGHWPMWNYLCCMGRYLKGTDQTAKELLEMVGRGSDGHRSDELSGGQKQRVAIARAMANNPSIILADEPTGALDSKTGRKIMDIFHKLHKEQGKTIVLITHSQELAEETERILTLKDGEIVAERGGSRVC